MPTAHESRVDSQFGPRAEAYVQSAVHAQGPDLDALETILHTRTTAGALDIGTGGGHVAYLLARHATHVTASDLSPQMLQAVAATARDKQLANIETVEAAAEHLPFDAASFDLVACRYSAHHWHDFEAGLREARRVLPPGSPAIFIDAASPGPAMLDTHLQAIELLRDTSHVRNRSAAEWTAALARAGFTLGTCRTWRIRMEFPVWIARMRTPQVNANAIRALQHAATPETRTHFAIEPDGSFMLDILMLETTTI